MSDLDEHEQRVDALMRASVPNLRTATMRSPIPNLRKRHGSARNNWMVALSTTVVLIVGLVAIGTDRTDQSPGNDSSRLHWQVIVLPDGLNPTFIAEPGSQAGPPGTTTMVNVYATAAAPAGPVVAVSASMGRPGLDIIPAAAGSNFEETTINGRRAAFADATFGQRLLFIEVDGSLGGTAITKHRRQHVARIGEGYRAQSRQHRTIAPAHLVDGLALVSPADALAAELGGGSDRAAINYADTTGRSIDLKVGPARQPPRAIAALQAVMTPTKVGDIDGFVGTFSFEVGNSQPNRVTHVVWWERDGLAFQLSGTQLSEAETLAAAASTEPASDKKWSELLHATGADSNGSMIGPLPRPADQELACCNPPNVVTADPNAASLRVSRSNGDRYTIALHDLPGADDLRIAVVGVLDGVQPMELLDAAGNVLQTL